MTIDNRRALYWHSFFLAVTMSFTEVNTVMPALILAAGGGETAVGVLTGIMIGLPLISQLLFAGFLHARDRKKPFLLIGINLRVLALVGAAVGIARLGTTGSIIPVVFVSMAIFALSGAFAGVSYTDLVGKLVATTDRRRFFVNRQVATGTGLLISAVVTRVFLGQTVFPTGYIVLFAMAATFLLVATGGFWMLHEPPSPPPNGTPRPGFRDAFREVPRILASDQNMRGLITVVNLAAPGFTAIPLVTALAHRTYEMTPVTAGTFVVVQICGMLVANALWTRLIKRGGFRLVVRAELIMLGVLFPVALTVAGTAPLWVYAGLYLITGGIISAQKLGVDAVLVQISPDTHRALYAGVFGAANIGTAVMPLVTGVLVASFGFTGVFAAAAVLSLIGLIPLRKIWCGEWYLES
ncbi:MAG: MFS transporter [Spirochaeta sp.]|jgi:MFS family permease|nr:MFS transporter [Spirochaeta sp.]